MEGGYLYLGEQGCYCLFCEYRKVEVQMQSFWFHFCESRDWMEGYCGKILLLISEFIFGKLGDCY